MASSVDMPPLRVLARPAIEDEESMRLPGTRYQEHGWEQVRKLLGQCSLAALARIDPLRLLDADCDAVLPDYVDLVAHLLAASGSRGAVCANSYGETAMELALSLVYELQARPADWHALCGALAAEHARIGAFWSAPGGEASLRKKFNDLYALLRDKVDSDNYQAACGRPCSPNRIYAYRMLDTAYGEVARLFGAWREHRDQVGAILGRSLDAEPIEARQLRSVADCRPEWIMRWSETLEAHSGARGPLHTRSKRFASLKTSPDKIGAMLREIGEYGALSSNQDRAWLHDASDASVWLDDYWRVLDESEAGATPGPDQLLEARQDELDLAPVEDAAVLAPTDPPMPLEPDLALRVSLPPSYPAMAAAAQDSGSWALRTMAGDSLAVRLAVYLKLLGAFDDSYPPAWLDPATGALPTMQQLALIDGVSLPTLRKRRDAAIARLGETAGTKENN
ncbi:hypothetical protein [Massilia sp. H6]|uniref:hypothetical protein n=1 Tax=Massilia sp. H6 TaxID=2970464 RepID=UPI0021672D72|nr:hypothetical protein [Massilia sp. H6]UVW26898.1 hypothetical protein NRS07_09920 [Massilia sp. H6]